MRMDRSLSTGAISAQVEELNEYFQLFGERVEAMCSIPGYTPSDDSIPPPMAVMYASTMVAPLRRIYSWGVPSTEALEEVAHHSANGVVEMGAGTGYWAWLLRNMGVAVSAYDIHPTNGLDQNGHHALELGKTGKSNPPPFTSGTLTYYSLRYFNAWSSLGRSLPSELSLRDAVVGTPSRT
eukprot:1188484-Prorocentrum_minimum.AAC.2